MIPPFDRATRKTHFGLEKFIAFSQLDLLNTCLLVMPFSVIVSLSETTLAGIIYDCFSTIGNCGASNELQIVLLACVLPSYNSTEAGKVEIIRVSFDWCKIVRRSTYLFQFAALCRCNTNKRANFPNAPYESDPWHVDALTMLL